MKKIIRLFTCLLVYLYAMGLTSALLAQTCPSWTFSPTTIGTTGTISTTTLTGQYTITNNVVISGTVNLVDAEILMSSGVTITVLTGSVLRVNHSHLFACGTTWTGIRVNDGATLIVENDALIEDAYIAASAVFVQNATAPATLDISNSMFNKNQNGIFISQFYNNTGNYPFTITNCVFTSRDLPNLLPNNLTTNALKSLNGGSILEPPYIDNSSYAPVFVQGTSNYPSTGIKVLHVGTTSNINLASPTNTPTYEELEIGSPTPAEFNLFDNLRIGIDIVNSNFTCHNAVFQNTDLVGGLGLRAIAAKDNNNRCRIIPFSTAAGGIISGTHNRFYNCKRGVQSRDYLEMEIEYASFRSLQTVNVNATSNIGDFGYRGTSNRFHYYSISRDTFYNIGNPVAFFGTQSPTPFAVTGAGNLTQYSGDIYVNENLIRPYPILNSITNEYISNAITVSSVPFPLGSFAVVANTFTIDISQNSIAEVYRGILSENWAEKWQFIRENAIDLRLQPIPTGADIPIQYAIRFNNNTGVPSVTPPSPVGKFIVDNGITGFGLNFPNTFGMMYSLDLEMQVTCNYVKDTEMGTQFRNGNTNTIIFENNSMEQNHFGYSLENNCIIGDQGSSTVPSDNQWLGTWAAPNFMTNVVNSPSTLSSLFIRSTPAEFNPDGFGTGSVPTIIYDFVNTNLFPLSSPPSIIECPAPPNTNILPSPIYLFEQIAKSEIPYYCNTEVAQFMSEYDLYTWLENEPRWRDSSAILDSFYFAHRSLVFGQLYEIDTTIATADWQAAQSLLNNFYPNTTVEENYKNYYTWYIKIQTDSTGLTTDENAALYNLAISCVGEGGKVVQYAQALYNFYNDTLVVFADTCDCVEEESRLIAPNNIPIFSIVPNPTSDNIRLLVNQKSDFIIEIRDMQGKTIEKTLHQAVKSEVFISTKLTSGIYFIQLTNTLNHEQQTQKVIIY